MSSVQVTTFAGALVCLLALAGCAGEEASPAAQEYASLNVTLLEDNANEVVECVKERTGFEVTADPDGSVGYTNEDVPESQYEIVDAAIPECFEELGFITDGVLSDEQKTRMYALQVEARNCLAEQGYDTPEPPSEAVYLDTYGTPEYWAPWGHMGNYQLSSEEMTTLLAACPDPGAFASQN